MQVTLGEMQVASRLFQIVMAQQDLNGAQVRTGLEEMRRKTVPQRVRMNIFLEAGALGGLLASLPNGFGIDGVIGAMVVMARKEQTLGFGCKRCQGSRSSCSNLGLSITSRSLRLDTLRCEAHALASMSLTFRWVNSARRTPVA